MNDKTAQLLEKLAAKLGTTAEYLWSVLLKQAHVEAISNCILLVIEIAIISTYVYYAKRWYKSEEEDHDIPPAWIVVGGIVSLIGLVMGFMLVDGIITAFANPEYWALNKVLDTLK